MDDDNPIRCAADYLRCCRMSEEEEFPLRTGTPKLAKEICMKCHGKPWTEKMHDRWERGYVTCPQDDEMFWWHVDDPRQIACKYHVEHLVMTQMIDGE